MKSAKRNNEPQRISRGLVYRPIWFIAIALVCFFLGAVYMRSNPEPRMKPQHTSHLLEVPTRPVLKGESLTEVPFTKVQWPGSSSLDSLVRFAGEVRGYVAKVELPAYRPIARAALKSPVEDINAVVEGIPKGYRAITVKVDIESVVEGWAQAGSYVDVILLKRSSDQEQGMEAKVIAENVKILAAGASVDVGDKSQRAGSAPQTVTLLVSQEDALKVRTATTIGKLTFALRGNNDKLPTTSVSMSQKALMGGARSVSVRESSGFRGTARGPNGEVYILDSDSGWVKNLDANKEQD